MRYLSLALVALFVAWSPQVQADPVLQWMPLPPLPDPVGFAGSFAGVSNDALIVGGGANFPDRPQLQGGMKAWHDAVFVLDDAHGPWKTGFKLPRPIAYGISVTTRGGIICVGGGDAERHFTDVFRLEWVDGRLLTTSLPPLPRPCAFGSGAVLDQTVYVAGGIDRPGATTAMHTFWSLDLSQAQPRWRELEPWPGPERMLAVAAAQDGAFFLVSGTRLKPGADGKAVREYLTDAYRYTPGQGWRRSADVPRPAVAAPSPAPLLGRTQFLVVGGDDGSRLGFQPPELHPGFCRDLLAYDTRTDRWTTAGTIPFSLVTVPQVPWRGFAVLPGGESRPGIRSPEVWAAEPVRSAPGLGTLDYVTLGGALLALALVASDWRRRPRVGISLAGPATAYAWGLVALLWVVAVLNYLDRQIIFSVFPLLQDDMHLSNVQLGLVSTVFLGVYGLLSPFAGFLADRHGRKRVILVSLLVWSVVTWLTGHARNVEELLGARALMGLSEACYLPAALALIAGYHGERSRSLATGVHQSGLYVGIILGGVGGAWLGEHFGWRWAFALLGVAGVLYAVVLHLALRETEQARRAAPRLVPLRFWPALAELARLPGFGTLTLVFAVVAVANWAVYTWLPIYLYERFRMSLTAAGFSATFYIQAASLTGILFGGWLADRWSAAGPRGRLATQIVGLLIAGPCLAAIGVVASETLLIGGLILYGLGRGLYDCNTMPVLCQIAPTDLRSTGYGVFNLAGCLAGGGIAVLAAALKDSVGLGSIFQLVGLVLFLATLLLWRLPVRTTTGHG